MTICEHLRPVPNLTVSQWADKYRYLPRESAAEPGPWSTDRTPYLREIMDCLSPYSGVSRVVFMKPAQVGGTEAAINLAGFVVHLDPSNMLIVQPTIEVARDKFSKLRIAPTVAATPELRSRITDRTVKDSGNTLMMKEFPGGSMILTGANSPAGLRSMPIKYLVLDEIDEYPADVGGQGDPKLLARERTQTYAWRKEFDLSTPTEAGLSAIESEYEASDQRQYHVPCPDCGQRQVLEWANLRFDHKDHQLTGEVLYACRHCGVLITEDHKQDMLVGGKWIPRHKGRPVAGFHINGLYSPWKRWADIVQQFLSAKKDNNPQKFKVWLNTSLAEVWEPPSEKIDIEQLQANVSRYGPLLPPAVCLLTASVDVQADRLEYEILGWGLGLESWGIEHGAISGDPRQPHVWQDLETFLRRPRRHALGVDLQISRVFVDSGYLTDDVYKFTRRRTALGYFAIKGEDRDDKKSDIVIRSLARTRKVRGKVVGGVPLYSVRTNTTKDVLYAWLTTEAHGPGYCHFPEGDGYEGEYFKQLTAEHQVVKGRRRVWEKRRPGLRNEALDLRVYNIAAIYSMASDPYRLVEARAKQLERKAEEMKKDESPAETPPPKPAKAKRRRKGGFVKNW
ncbi:MAG: phage terminase large subunit family protein [bacterium]|nr:phage terminase large subunit family protein [bacterium]